MAEVVRAELRLESIFGMTERCRHDTGIGNNHVERITLLEEPIRARSYTLQSGQIERHHFETATINCCVLPHFLRGSIRFFQIACCADYLAPCAASERAVSTPRPEEIPVTRTRLPLRFNPDRTSSVVEVSPNAFAIFWFIHFISHGFSSIDTPTLSVHGNRFYLAFDRNQHAASNNGTPARIASTILWCGMSRLD